MVRWWTSKGTGSSRERTEVEMTNVLHEQTNYLLWNCINYSAYSVEIE